MTVVQFPVQAPLADHAGRHTRLRITRHTRLRITRRGRATLSAFVTLLVLAVVAFGALFGAAQAQASSVTGQQEFGYIVVQPGDSLWQISADLDPQADPRDVIAELIRLNQLEGSDVEGGQALAVPLRLLDAPGVILDESSHQTTGRSR
jgi:hypothetical protein